MTYFVTELSVATELEDEPIGWLFWREVRSSHTKMAPDTG
jgi:hypothetical protein